jgi:hypothetical protein
MEPMVVKVQVDKMDADPWPMGVDSGYELEESAATILVSWLVR